MNQRMGELEKVFGKDICNQVLVVFSRYNDLKPKKKKQLDDLIEGAQEERPFKYVFWESDLEDEVEG